MSGLHPRFKSPHALARVIARIANVGSTGKKNVGLFEFDACRRRTAEQRGKLAPSHVEHGAFSPLLDRRHPQ
jgi:hypothetical protein